jgi:hypothetical protein
MSDLPYIVTHPLLRKIIRHCGELEEQALVLPEGSKERKALEKRIGKLQEYGLPTPTTEETEQTETIKNQLGQKICERHSIRRRPILIRRGRRAMWRVKARAWLEERLSNPKVTWKELSEKTGFPRDVLEREIYLLIKLLKREEIELPTAADYRTAEDEWNRGMAALDAERALHPDPFGFLLPKPKWKPKKPARHKSRTI